MNAFATRDNVERIWSEGISHGELVRTNTDQTMTIDPCQPLEYLFQGNDPAVRVDDYIKIPYRLGVITAKGPNPVSALCRRPGVASTENRWRITDGFIVGEALRLENPRGRRTGYAGIGFLV